MILAIVPTRVNNTPNAPAIRLLRQITVLALAAIAGACSSTSVGDAVPASDAGSFADAGSTPDATIAPEDAGSEIAPVDAAIVDDDAEAPDAGNPDAASVATVGPCDIYALAKTPCVAAHSTVRALFGAYAGRLYQVTRASDKTKKDIGVLAAGGIADAAAQDTFCAGTKCTISIVYDQSANANDLRSAPGGGAAPGADVEADATAFGLTIAGHRAYAIYVNPGVGYRNDKTKGIATGDDPEGMYMVTSGKHFNGSCCFDYGNAETNNKDTGAGHMEAVYFGGQPLNDAGAGPRVAADLENGLFDNATRGSHAGDNVLPFDFVTAMLKGTANKWAISGANAQAGALEIMFEGVRPSGYTKMLKEGAIILGIGGDNSNRAAGTFFEGCMTKGYPTAAADRDVHANIVAAAYGK